MTTLSLALASTCLATLVALPALAEEPVFRYKSATIAAGTDGDGSDENGPPSEPDPAGNDVGDITVSVTGDVRELEYGNGSSYAGFLTVAASGGSGGYALSGVGTPDWVRMDYPYIDFFPEIQHVGDHSFTFRVTSGDEVKTFGPYEVTVKAAAGEEGDGEEDTDQDDQVPTEIVVSFADGDPRLFPLQFNNFMVDNALSMPARLNWLDELFLPFIDELPEGTYAPMYFKLAGGGWGWTHSPDAPQPTYSVEITSYEDGEPRGPQLEQAGLARILSPSEYQTRTGTATDSPMLMITNYPVPQGWSHVSVSITASYAGGLFADAPEAFTIGHEIGLYTGPAEDMSPGGCTGIC